MSATTSLARTSALPDALVQTRSSSTVLPLWAALLIAAAAGPVLDWAFPDGDVWPVAFLGIGLVLFAARGRSFGGGLLVGLVFGMAFYFLHIEWATTFLGPLPWAALSTLMALWTALGTGFITLAYRWVPRVWPSRLASLLLLPAIVAGIWTAREGISAVWPYGGFSWGRVSFSESEGPFAQLFSWVGPAGVTFLMVFLTALAIEAVRERRVDGLLRAVLVTATAFLLVALPAWPTIADGTLRVGAVQGDTKAGYFDPPANYGDNLIKQYEATKPVYDQNVDVVLWPEGSSDVDPLAEPAAAQYFDSVTELAGAPLVAGIITSRGDENFNEVVLWENGGAQDYYDKKHPVPFGEYVPDRAFWRPFAPDLIDLIGREYTIGTTDGVLDVGKAIAGIAICFDIVDDRLMTGLVDDGAQVVFAPTNNADFGHTDESVQQLAIARIRALELGRSVVNISTVGTSALLLPNGETVDRLPTYEEGTIIDDVPIYNGVTPAVAIGGHLELLLGGVGLLGLLVAGISVRLNPGRRAQESHEHE